MNRFAFVIAACALLFPAPIGAAQEAPAAATPAPGQPAFAYSDAGMSFAPPLTYYRLPIPLHSATQFDQATVVAEWVYHPGKNDRRTITITMENFNGTLEGAEMVSENELRNQADGVFFKKKEHTKLSNGMPAFWQEISVGSGFTEAKRFEYVWIDGLRSVSLALTGRFGEFDEAIAKTDLTNATGVLYPQYRN